MSVYIHKSHNVSILLYHLVFPAKYRRAVLTGPQTSYQGKLKRVFRILHEPWDLTALENEWLDTTLLETDSPWPEGAEAVGSYWTRGAFDVKISRPRRIG